VAADLVVPPPAVLASDDLKVAADRAKVVVRAVGLAIATAAVVRVPTVEIVMAAPPMARCVAAVDEAIVAGEVLVADLPSTTAIRKTTRKAKRK
jgi:hypothetical protein